MHGQPITDPGPEFMGVTVQKMNGTHPLPAAVGSPSFLPHPGCNLLPSLSCSYPLSVLRTQIFHFFLLQSETFCILFILKTIYKGNNNILWLLALIAPGILYASLWEQRTPCHVLLI